MVRSELQASVSNHAPKQPLDAPPTPRHLIDDNKQPWEAGMAGRVAGKVALVTGGSSGIGRGCAELLAAEGATVVVTDLQDDKGQAVAAAIGGLYLHHDVADEDAWAL